MSEDSSDGSIDIGRQLQESDERNKRKRDEVAAEESESSSMSNRAAQVLAPVAFAVPFAVAAPVAAPVAASLPRPRLSLHEIQHRHQMQIQQLHQQHALVVPPPALEYYDDEFGQDMYMGQLKAQELRERPPRHRTTPSPKEHARSTSASPLQRSASASPLQRSASPAMRKAAKEAAKQVQKKKKESEKIAKKAEGARLAKKKDDEKISKKAEEVRLATLISAMIGGYDHTAHKHKIVCGQEKSPKDGEIYNVAMTMTLRKDQPNEEVLYLSKFTSKDIRALALKCGVRGGGNMTIFTARMEIARSIQMGTMYTDLSIANPGSDAAAVRINTLIKLLNICFHADNFTAFVALNDSKGRKDYEEQPLSEKGVSGNPVKDFWLLVSDTMNETDDDSFDTVLGLQEGENDRLSAWNQDNGFNLKDISRGHTFKTVKQHVCDLMKSRERCRMEMKKSGEHSNDLWTYCTTTKFTKVRKSTSALPAVTVYYCDYLCGQQPAIDGKFAAFMDEDLKSDSTVDFTGSADSAGSKAGKLAVSAVVESLATATTDLKEAMSQRNNVTEEISQTNSWNDYFDVGNRYCKLKEDIRNGDLSKARMVGAMEVRIGQLEAHLKIVPAKSVIETSVIETEETGALAE